MGTRADFYIGRGEQAEWIGSIALDGYPDGVDASVLSAASEQGFRDAVAAHFAANSRYATLPTDGWPWPWDDSTTSDYAYCFDGRVWATSGSVWFDPLRPEPMDPSDLQAMRADGDWSVEDEEREATAIVDRKTPVRFPNMESRKSVTFGSRSGLIVIGA